MYLNKKGRNHVLRIIRDFLSAEVEPGGTALKEAFEETVRIMKQAGIIFIISDFIAEGYESALKRLGKKHDLVVVPIEDPAEASIPPIGTVYLQDPETGTVEIVDTSRRGFQRYWQQHQKLIKSFFD